MTEAALQSQTESNDRADDAAHPKLPAALTSEMSRLFSAGFSLLPLGGVDGKRPVVNFRNRKRFPLSLVIDRMAGSGSKSYGLRLTSMVVVDVDTDTLEAREYVERRFGSSSARTRTSRGMHLFFRHSGAVPTQVRLPGIAIDFKTGENQFVVGPQSERPDGAIYWPEGRLVSISDLPRFEDRDGVGRKFEGERRNGRYPVGSRNDVLKRRGRELADVATDYETFLADLVAFRDWEFEEPTSFPDTQVEKLAEWFWHKRVNGQLWKGRNSAVLINRSAMDALVPAGHHLPLSLLVFLTAEHAHNPDAPFAIDPDALRGEGHFKDGRRQLYGAIQVLCDNGLLKQVRKARGRRNYHEYRLVQGRKEEEQEEVYSYISAPNGHPKKGPVGEAA